MNVRFAKYTALGNDMVVIDPATFEPELTPEIIRTICHRHFGLGADGICNGPLPEEAHPTGGRVFAMRFYNPDGTEAEKSGNGLRIFARYLWDQRYVQQREFDIAIQGAVSHVTIEDERAHTISNTMGRLRFDSASIPMTGEDREVVDEVVTIDAEPFTITAVNTGNPHCVVFHHETSPEIAQEWGPVFEMADLFPNRTNVQFVRVVDRNTIQIEIWERGAGYTLASGTSSCAAAGAAVRTGRCKSPVTVRMAGGIARVVIDDNFEATLTGSVRGVAEGDFAPDLVAKFG